MRPVRETMGIARGADKLPLLMTGTLVAMLAANPLFARLVSRLPRRRFIPIMYRFFAGNLVAFFVIFQIFKGNGPDAKPAALVNLGYAFYIWLSVFNLFVVSIFWGFMADLWGRERGRRLFGIIGIGGTLGAIVGAYLVGALRTGIGPENAPWIKLTAPQLMLLAIVPLELAVQCVLVLSRQPDFAAPRSDTADAAREPSPRASEGFRLLAASPYLRFIALYMLLFTVTSTVLYYQQARIIEQTYPDETARTKAFANIDLWTNVLTLLTQMFLTGHIIRYLGVAVALAILPTLTLFGFGLLWAHPAIGALMVFQVARRGLHYAVDRPTRETLFAGLSPDSIYKSKPFIDTFVYRAGDMIGAWAPQLLAKTGLALGWLSVPLAALWLVGAILLGLRPEVRTKPDGSRKR
jgi:AAA family ATP:ADP antiporter